MARDIDIQLEQERLRVEAKIEYEKALVEARETLKMIELLENNEGWRWLKARLTDKANASRAAAMMRERGELMARDLGYMSALLDAVNLPEDHAKVLKTQLANSKL